MWKERMYMVLRFAVCLAILLYMFTIKAR